MGGRGSSGIRNTATSLTSEDWDDWTQDPTIYQRLERGEDISEEFYDTWGEDEWEEQYNRATQIARELQNQAESEVLNTSTLYRGERFNSLAEAQRKYAIGNVVTTDKLTSYAKNESLAREYATMYGGVAVVITNKSTNGNFVAAQAHHSNTKNDPEVLVARGHQSKVTNTHYDAKTNTLYVELESKSIPKRRR